MTKEQCRAYMKAYYEAHKEKIKAAAKAYYEEHREECNAATKAWRAENRDYWKAWREEHKEEHSKYLKAYQKSDLNSLGQTKSSIRWRSRHILKQMHLHIPGYEIHHCFGYDDPSRFIYISKELHLKIHQFLRDNNIDAGHDHWMAIRDMVNATDEFTYIKC